MKYWILAVSLVIFTVPVVGSAASQARKGQRLFAGCLKKVDDKATLKAGVFVCKGDRDPAPFAGNGRSCGDCHVPGDNFGISLERIATLPNDHPFFFNWSICRACAIRKATVMRWDCTVTGSGICAVS
jgi:hypothetical protein